MIKYKGSIARDFLVLISALIFMLVASFVYRINNAETKVLKQDLENSAINLTHNFTEVVNYTGNILVYMAHQISKNGNPQDYEYISNLFSAFDKDANIKQSLSWTLVSWMDSSNKIRLDAKYGVMDENNEKGIIDLSYREYQPFLREEPFKIKLDKPTLGTTSGKWIIPAAVGVTNSKGIYIGGLAFGFEVEKIKEQFKNILEGKNIKFALVDARHKPVIESDEALLIKKSAIENIDFQSNREQVLEEVKLFNQSSYYIYKIPELPYAIYLSYNDGVIASKLKATLMSGIPDFIVAFLILFVISYYFYKRIIYPVKELSEVASSIHEGTNVKTPKQYSIELASLARQILNVKRFLRREQKLKQKQAELLQIIEDHDREKEAFLRDMYHVLNTPLNAIINGADIARNQMLGKDITKYNQYFDAMYEAGMQLKCFTTGFLNPELIDIGDIIEKCAKIQRKFAAENGSTLLLDIPEKLPEIWADRLRMRQVILSTLYHSLYYVSDGRQCKISARAHMMDSGKPGYLVITIKDNGWGTNEKSREEDWQMRFGNEEEDSYSRNPDMMKLSFSTMRHMMRLHHGSFDIQTKNGQGSVFTIRLPYMQKEDLQIHPDDFLRENKPITLPKNNKIINFPKKGDV